MDSVTTLHVIFRIADVEYLICAEEVLQLESYAATTPVPGAPAFVVGIIQVRGRVVPVIDLRERFHLPRIEPTLGTRIVVAEARGRCVGLIVDSAREVIHVTPEQLKPPPRVLVERAEGFIQAVAQVGDRFLMLIDFNRVIGEEQLPS
jgi:purine-binding chemotaxis protein CheW